MSDINRCMESRLYAYAYAYVIGNQALPPPFFATPDVVGCSEE